MDLLPPDFRFEPYLGGPCLRFGDEVVASASPANDDPSASWRVVLCARQPPRYVFLKDEASSKRYMAAWARKWEGKIRERCRHAAAHP